MFYILLLYILLLYILSSKKGLHFVLLLHSDRSTR